MTRHLSGDVLAELAESGASHPHLAECERCSTGLRDAREALAEARRLDVPEPSPLFWQHFSVRVHEGIEEQARSAAEQGRTTWMRLYRSAWLPVAAAVLIVCAAAVSLVPRIRQPEVRSSTAVARRPAPVAPQRTPGDDVQAAAEMLAPASDPSWGVIAHVAQSIQFEDSVFVQPGATDRAVAHLSVEEQQEFMRLLQSDLNGPPSQ